jgi:hypothetical protein
MNGTVCCFRYFFYVLLALVVVGLFTGLVFFPVLLSLIGPAAEVSKFIIVIIAVK